MGKKLEVVKLKSRSKSKNPLIGITLDIKNVPGLWEALVTEADSESRTIKGQIVHFCKEGLKFNQEVKEWERKF